MPSPPAPVVPSSGIGAWFQRRQARDPRRWVLALAALEGLATAAGLGESRSARRELELPLLVLSALWLVLAPAIAIGLLFVRARLLYWSGRLLHGRARPLELRAAIAWAGLPLALVGLPAALDVATRLALSERAAPPGWLRFLHDLAHGLSGAALTAVAGAVELWLWLSFVAAAQGFSRWRALMNLVLAGLLLLALLGGGGALGWAARESRLGVLLLGALAAVAIGARVFWAVRARGRSA